MNAEVERQRYAQWWTQPDAVTAARARKVHRTRLEAFRQTLRDCTGKLNVQDSATMLLALEAMQREAE